MHYDILRPRWALMALSTTTYSVSSAPCQKPVGAFRTPSPRSCNGAVNRLGAGSVFSPSHLVLVDLLLQDLVGVRVHLHLLLLLQLPPQSGQVLLGGV